MGVTADFICLLVATTASDVVVGIVCHMYLFYIDESGDTVPLSQKGKKFLVLTGCIINEKDRVDIELELRKIKHRFFQDDDIEIKSNFLRYANPDIIDVSSPLKLHDRGQYDKFEAEIKNYLLRISIELISVVIDKSAYWEQNPSQNPYEIAYLYLLERFQMYLKSKNSLGICIIDPREGQVEKTFIGDSLEKLHHAMRWNDGEFWKKCPNIIERLLYSTSEGTIGIQIADLYCYPIFHVFEYNKTATEYWRFSDVTLPKLYRVNGKLDGYGLKFFPDKTKKDLKIFETHF